MNRSLGVSLCFSLAAVVFCAALSLAQSKAQIERGKYLVVEVARCGDCHTPTNKNGEPIPDRWLKGAMLPFKPTVPMPWAEQSVNIAGLPSGWKQEDAVAFFVTGKHLGSPPVPPMPEYHLTKADAEAMVAYLRSLAPAVSKK